MVRSVPEDVAGVAGVAAVDTELPSPSCGAVAQVSPFRPGGRHAATAA